MTSKGYRLLDAALAWVPAVVFPAMFLFKSALAAGLFVTLSLFLAGGLRALIAPRLGEIKNGSPQNP